MKTSITLILVTILSFFAPISLCVVLLMGVIFLDTIVKLLSLITVAKESNRRYLDVFESEILRKKFVLKSIGYMILAVPVATLDILILSPALDWVVCEYFDFKIPIEAVFSNFLLIIFCFMELSSINENWNALSGNNIFKSVVKAVKEMRKILTEIAKIKKEING